MKAKTYEVTLTGVTPLLLHHDNISWAETLKVWSMDPANKQMSVPGDDRTPAHRWMGNLYVEGGLVVIPSDNLMTMLREGGKRCPTGKRGATFKAQTQSGLVVDQSAWPIVTAQGEVKYSRLEPLLAESDFSVHEQTARDCGFQLFVKRARVNQQKHVRVRPRFDTWAAQGTITVLDEMITKDVLQTILTHAGTYAGMCDWRPSSPKSPGPFGKFTATVK
jgi:hypothetical protein